MPLLNSKLGIDFSGYIADRTLNFTGREWVFEAIQNWLADSNGDRFFLLTGEPGSGKTAIAARLAQFAQGAATYLGLEAGFLQAVHFCSARDSGWTDPKEFARSLALQLAASIPEFGLALKDVGEKTTNINVDLTFGTAQNCNIQGVVIQNLTLSDITTGQEAFTQAVVNPLRQIQQEGFSQPVTILVDSLDEALTHDGESTIVSLVSKLSANVKLRLILTSRNEGRVKEELEEYKELFLSAPENLDKNQQDVRAYINAKFRQEKPLQNSLQAEALDQGVLTANLIEKSEGNFLYVRFLLEAVALGQQSFANLNGLPQGLDELYYSSLGRVVELGKKDWSEVYAPVMGVLLAAQESLTESQIRAFTKLKESVVWNCLTDLQQFLDEIESEDEETLYKLYHQSVTDFWGKKELRIRKEKVKKPEKVKNRYYLPGQEQHQRLLEYYRPEGKLWAEVQLDKIDPYGRRYLAQHLVKAERVEELHTLLSLEKDGKNAWFKVKDDEGDIASFLADVELAWSQADRTYNHEPGRSIGLQCRYALIKASINSLADIPTPLMVALVKHQYWKPIKGLTYTRQMPDQKERFETLIALADQLPDSEQLKPQFLQSALQVALAMQEEFHLTNALSRLAHKLTPELLPKALEAALAIQDNFYRAQVLTALSDKLPNVLSKALEAARAIPWEPYRAQALTALVDKLPEVLREAIETILAIEDVSGIDDAWTTVYGLTAIANKITPELLSELLESVLEVQDESYRVRLLIALAENDRAFSKALEAALAIQDVSKRIAALTYLEDKLPSELLSEVLESALKIALAEPEAFWRANALSALAGKIPSALPMALEAILAIQTEKDSDRADALSYLANKLTPELLPKALEITLTIQNELSRAKALFALAGKLTPELFPQALEAVLAIQDLSYRAYAISALAAKLSPKLLPQVLEAILIIQDTSRYAHTLAILADGLPTEIPRILSTVQVMHDEILCVRVLIAIADKLAPEPFSKALAVILTTEDKALFGLLDRLSPEQAATALESCLVVLQNERDRIRVLVALADKLPAAAPKALETALALQDEYDRAHTLIALVDKLPAALPKALEAVLAVQDDGSEFNDNRAKVLFALIDKLTPELLPRALEAALSLRNERDRAHVLIVLVGKLPTAFSQAVEAVLAIQDINALSALADGLSLDLVSKVLEAVLAIQDEDFRVQALIELADKSSSAASKALEAILATQDEYYRACRLINLAEKLPAAAPKALEAVLVMEEHPGYERMLIALAEKLPAAAPKALEAIFAEWRDHDNITFAVIR